ncbi:NAD-dependent epimerase/dehydratase family protein [Tuwongella immobilis]|uniref:NAD-dependent epimerase/dehydratase domain-containing protein n=1 Tax=Tuwongella immobilis TaxID=692036 RepID=A0A6C2YIK5_9BACT|nr:NAD-dependent epimerase/dehydratase family protein [Tuwongella immobilis]VIP01111.1 nad-dependent epimerase dehydratase : Nucleoside-diphosphate-sugar epimerase OS=Singulisphaera acidiphila (strain ATCC BAA-1392 / DSM 18658 / VKM B-2454 / MOB10) GN=Sinac_3219 PE=4 SV=1: Epimerase [Tuwongella immobilis]VTR97647.1 nad-dependent epimerase dehydratase : Nucleoside-diphosphate-sugar epimerase OS=Singulisphaera acidiphila (strain ATCC BAA-1392 / DSM 18658 / VKM B-2454 / MOB10) GN=Sinac_3219 PE=4 SV=
MGERILVTGGAGFIGQHLVQQLLQLGHSVRVLDRPGARTTHLPLADLDYLAADIRDASAVARAVAGCDAVYHLAANPQLWTLRRSHFHQVNTLGTRNVLEAAVRAGVRRTLHTSTESILTRAKQTTAIAEDQPITLRDVIGPYCRSKFRAEQIALRMAREGAEIIIVNPTLPVGPGDWGRSPPTQMLLDCAMGQRSAYLDADLNLVDVRDVASGMIAAMERGVPRRRYLLAGENWSIRRVFEAVASRTGAVGPQFPVPYAVALIAAVVSECIADWVTHRIPAASITGVRLTRRRMHFDPQTTQAALAWQARPATESLDDALAWFREVGWIPTRKS